MQWERDSSNLDTYVSVQVLTYTHDQSKPPARGTSSPLNSKPLANCGSGLLISPLPVQTVCATLGHRTYRGVPVRLRIFVVGVSPIAK